MRNFSTEGIILKRMNRGEHDQCIILFSPILGKITAYAKGARKITSSFSGHLEPFNICDFELYRSARGYTITQCRSTETFKTVRANLEKTLNASLAGELFEKTASISDQSEELFTLLKSALNALGKSEKTDLALESFKIKLMLISGILPELRKCATCGKKPAETECFTLSGGGQIFCPSCLQPEHGLTPLPFGIIKLINYICLCDFKAIEKVTIRKHEQNLLKNATGIFLGNYLDREIASEAVLRSIY
jgi:DNA repair protein RecO (recombination protein O)